MDHNQSLRAELDKLLSGHGAHADFDAAVAGFPAALRGAKPEGAAHSPWQVVEHLRIAQWDMLEFSRDPNHVSPDWPAGYWPAEAEPPNAAAWDHSVQAFQRDLKAMRGLVADPTPICSCRSRTARARRCCVRRCKWLIIMPITWAN